MKDGRDGEDRPRGRGLAALAELCRRVRIDILELAHAARSSHVAPALSCVELLVALHHRVMRRPRRGQGLQDRFLLSKGHGAMAYYACLASIGSISRRQLRTYCRNGSLLGEHPPAGGHFGIEWATGSLGHGLAVGTGLALAGRIRRTNERTFVLLSDGECNEGSTWEAAGLASTLRLDRLIAVVDANGLQATDTYERLSGGVELANAWRSFGWSVHEADGHDVKALTRLFSSAFFRIDRPKVIIARTVKGRGVSFMENDLEWHYRPPSKEDLARAVGELRGGKAERR